MSNEVTDENAFLIQKISDEEKNIIFHLNSTLPVLKRLSNVFKLKQENELTQNLLKNSKSMMTNLINFVIKSEKKNLNPFECEGK